MSIEREWPRQAMRRVEITMNVCIETEKERVVYQVGRAKEGKRTKGLYVQSNSPKVARTCLTVKVRECVDYTE